MSEVKFLLPQPVLRLFGCHARVEKNKVAAFRLALLPPRKAKTPPDGRVHNQLHLDARIHDLNHTGQFYAKSMLTCKKLPLSVPFVLITGHLLKF